MDTLQVKVKMRAQSYGLALHFSKNSFPIMWHYVEIWTGKDMVVKKLFVEDKKIWARLSKKFIRILGHVKLVYVRCWKKCAIQEKKTTGHAGTRSCKTGNASCWYKLVGHMISGHVEISGNVKIPSHAKIPGHAGHV